MVDIINSLKQYQSLYEFIGKQPRTKEDICQYATDVLGKKSRTTVLKYANQAFDGDIPLLIVKDDLISIDGVFQAMRLFEKNNVTKEIIYRDAKEIPLSPEKTYLIDIMNDLYLTIENIITGY
jgi:hypothetical protein